MSATPPTLISLMGVESLASAFGILTFSRGVAAMSGPPLVGWVVDRVGDTGVSMVVGGLGMTLSCATFTLVTLLNKRHSSRQSHYQQLS